MLAYPARLKAETDGGFVVTFRDIPEAITQGDTEAEALHHAQDALATAMEFYFEDQRPVPVPSNAKRGERLVALPLSETAKIILLNEMLRQKVGPSELARRMSTTKQEVNRITTLRHATKIDRVAEAVEALGGRLELHLT